MPTLDHAPNSEVAKIMLIGDSGAGKTGALTSLVCAGYHLRIVDMDNGLKPLVNLIQRECPDKLSHVSYVTNRDKFKATPQGMQLVTPAKAYMQATKLMDKWEDDTSPASWGSDYIFVVDSLTMLGQAALHQAQSLAPQAKDRRQWYFAAQQALENFLSCIFSEDFNTNVIVISHITEVEMNDGSRRGFPATIGSALSKHVAKYLNDLFIVETKGFGDKSRREIRTVPNGQTDAKTSSLNLEKALPIETGLATIFKELRGS